MLDQAEDQLAERERLSDLLFELSLKYDIVLSVLPVREYTLEQERKPSFINARREGIFCLMDRAATELLCKAQGDEA